MFIREFDSKPFGRFVFSTKNRVRFLKDPELRGRLHAYRAGVLQNIGCEPILINGVEDHVHILCNLSRTGYHRRAGGGGEDEFIEMDEGAGGVLP